MSQENGDSCWSSYLSEQLKPTKLDELTADWRDKPLSDEEADAMLKPVKPEPRVEPFVKLADLSDPVGKRKEDPFDDGSGG